MPDHFVHAAFGQGEPAGWSSVGTFQGDDPGGQAKPHLGKLINPAGQIGVIAGVEHINHCAMGLGLGGEVGLGRSLKGLAGMTFPPVGFVDPG